MRRALAAGSIAAALALGGPALGETKKECADAYVAAQVARKAGKAGEARRKLQICANASCPAALRKDCGPWLAEVEAELPAITVVVPGASARTAGLVVTLDGAAVEPGAAVLVEPGDHVVRLAAPGMKPGEELVHLGSGAGRRTVIMRLEPEGGPAPIEPPPSPVPAAPIALAVVGAASLGAFAALGAIGNGKKSDLDASHCKPDCARGDVTTIKALYISADASLGVGLAALVTSGILLLARPSAKAGPPAEPAVSLAPRPGGATITVRF